jgi:hypothetical protein
MNQPERIPVKKSRRGAAARFDRSDYRRRLRSAGLGGDAPAPTTDDEHRIALARRIHMAINAWRGCRVGICRRNRGCMAPDGVCHNSMPAPMSREEAARGVARGVRMISDAIAAAKARRGGDRG